MWYLCFASHVCQTVDEIFMLKNQLIHFIYRCSPLYSIQTKPNFNIMIGPSPYVLINMGARFTPCMHNIKKIIEADGGPVLQWPCPNTTTLTDNKCTLAELCGMGGGVPNQEGITDFKDRSHEPNQWWRFITPIFLHAGIIHIGFNMLLQWTLGRDMEKEIGRSRRSDDR